MKLKYITQPADLGGSAVPGCGTIHRSEIVPTLKQLSGDLEFPFDLNDYTIGSTGKREYSGDIDLVIDKRWYNHGPTEFQGNLIDLFGEDNVTRHGNMIHLKYPIVEYKHLFQECQPRNGFVQVDFNFGDADWERFYHFSAGEESAYKGGHRILAIAAICFAVNNTVSKILDRWDRPISQVKWKWSTCGFSKIDRHSVPDKNGSWHRKQIDTIIEGPYFDGNKIAGILFPYDGQISDLDSLETIMSAVKRNYGMVDQERIWAQMAHNFIDWNVGRNFVYPDEISRYCIPKR